MMVEDMKAAGLDPAFIYAFEKTGLLVTEQKVWARIGFLS
jgi:hypothetical protein